MKNIFSVSVVLVFLSACASAPVPPSAASHDQTLLEVERAVKSAQEAVRNSGLSDGPLGVF